MPSNTEITTSQLSRLVGLPTEPTIIDVRLAEDFDADPRLLSAAHRRNFKTVTAWLRHEGIPRRDPRRRF
ncbi:hypothetical protein [Mesorhizobium sp. KR9-304]|uniref:hypothetical protein n=1 Tax=Mesorhizobium sp. KR9-304 TaxID=3156614 RepID=UPI0032B43CAC